MTNRLAGESSPYLLQHKDNPVDWYPWGAEALARARDEDKPIFLSIGYSACHWCHVMEHESFENTEIAAMLNQRFVNIKVDREERPDLDQIYMNAVQMMTGRGGWPMSVFLTPDLQPFYGGTYWPPIARMGMPGFAQVIQGVDDAWRNRRDEAVAQAAKLTDHLRGIAAADATGGEVSEELLHAAIADMERDFDAAHGGFGTAPKFPHSMCLQFLLRVGKRTANDGILQLVRKNLDMMARGGIYDHLAGGFARYSVDERWLVPHFEKMLYDNALLAAAYIDGYLATEDAGYANVARATLDYTLRYMTDTEGGFHSTEDADSEGEEGKFYVWTPTEIADVLGAERADRFCYVYDVSEKGNFEGKNVLNLPKTIQQCAALKGWDLDELNAELQESRKQLLAARDRRVRPGKDDKVLTSWNALMIDSMARAAGAFDEPRYLAAARSAAEFVFREMTRADGRLLHAWRRGNARFDAYLDDYTYMINALVSLYQADFDERWIDRAAQLAETVIERFADRANGGFFYTADDHEHLLTRNKDVQDSSVPSGSSMAATALLRLGRLTGRRKYLDSAGEVVAAAADWIRRAPVAMGQALLAADMLLRPSREIVILGDADQILPCLRHGYFPDTMIAHRRDESAYQSDALDVLFEGKTARKAEATVYVCENFTCQAPITDIDTIRSAIAR